MKMHWSLILMASMALPGCSYEYYIKDEHMVAKQRQLFDQLCKTDDRLFINEKQKVDGYLFDKWGGRCFGTDGWSLILNKGYKYSECVDGRVRDFNVPTGSPIYHYTIDDSGSANCLTSDDHFVRNDRAGNGVAANRRKDYEKRHAERLEGKCLAVKIVNSVKSTYAYSHELFYLYDGKRYMSSDLYTRLKNYRTLKGMITMGRVSIFNVATRGVVGQRINYSFFPKGLQFSRSNEEQCEASFSLNVDDVLQVK